MANDESTIIHEILFRAVINTSRLPVCLNCGEVILPWEVAAMRQPHHCECALRAVVGSVAHVEGRCSCVDPSSEEGDPPGMTKREAARAACAAYYERNPEQLLPKSGEEARPGEMNFYWRWKNDGGDWRPGC